MKDHHLIFLVFIILSCTRKENDLPVVVTTDISEITLTSAKSGGNITDAGSSEIKERGVCWSTIMNPTIVQSKTSDGSGSGAFISILSGLSPNTTYHIRAYAINGSGTGYGDDVEFTTTEIEAWMEKPYFALPERGLALMAGQSATIYGDALINVPIHNHLQVSYTCDIGSESGNNYVLNPGSGNVGNHNLTITFRNNGFLIDQRTISFTVYNIASSKSKKILLIGDSTMPSDIQEDVIKNVLSNASLTFLGTMGNVYKNEGYPGSSWNDFLTGAKGKFAKGGSLNIPAYFADYSIATPDYVYIRLGINDTFQYSENVNDPITDENINSIISRAKTMVDAFLNYDPGIKILLGLPTISENSGAGWSAHYGNSADQDLFIEQMHRYWQALIRTFANEEYNARVDCSYDAIFLDRDNGYPKVNNIHNNGVHPGDSGYEQLGKGMAMAFNKLMNAD